MIKDLKENMVYVIIDALDECETSSCRNLLSVIRELTHNDSSKTVKFLLTSRPILYPPVEVEDVVKEGTIAIDDGELGYSDDIEQFIRHRVDEVALRHSCPEQTKRHLLKAMLSKAGNTFLWTHMVLESLEDSLLASAADFDTIISNLPQSLESTYAGFLAKVPKGNLSTAHCLLSLLLASSRNLRLDEINHALTITNRHQSSGEVSRDSQPAIARTIRGILGPLVRLSGQQVSLVHESVRDFLLRSEEDALSFRSYESCPGMPLITSKSAALQMATVCTLYLLLEDFQTPNSSPEPSPIDETRQTGFDEAEKASDDGDMWGEDTMGIDLLQEPEAVEADLLTGVASRHPFYSYAATKWHYHYSNCEANAPPELKSSVMALLELNNTAGRTWRRLARSQAIDAATSFPEESSSLAFASHLNLIEATKEILQYGCCSQQEKDEALFWSANGGHQRIVPMLLAANANSEYYSSERHTPLLIAAANGHLECVRLLLSHGCCNVNIKGKRGRTALSLAAGNGHHDVVRYLLKQDSIMPDLGDQSGATPFIWASGGGHLTIISALAKDRRVNIDSQDSQGRTALSWASGDGVEEVVNFLLKRVRGIDPNLGDNTGRTAFSWATGNGHSSVIRVLQQNPKVDKYRLDHDQRSPLSWACGHGHEGAVRALLECEPQGLEDKDMDGWTPMAWAIQCDAPGVIEALFDAGAKDLDEGPRTVLSWAMEYGHLAVVRMLLAKGADPETARDRIPFAEAMGRADLVKELSDALHSRGSYTQ
jgi:ankyrin repeat protein